jgi:hypothetical protein
MIDRTPAFGERIKRTQKTGGSMGRFSPIAISKRSFRTSSLILPLMLVSSRKILPEDHPRISCLSQYVCPGEPQSRF